MELLLEVLRAITDVVFVSLAVLALLLRRRQRIPATGWLAASFVLLAAVAVVNRFLPDDPTDPLVAWLTRLLIVGLVLFPYLLWRFQLTFRPARGVVRHLVTALTAIVAGAWLTLPTFTGPGEPRTAGMQALIVLLLFQWALISGAVTLRLWRAGAGQPTLARRRMRMMAAGTLWLVGALLLAGLAPSTEAVTPFQVAVQAFAIFSGPFFLMGFAPPSLVRTAWREPEERRLQAAEAELMSAETPAEVAAILLPHVSRLLGGGRAELYDAQGNLVLAEPGTGTEAGAGNLEVSLSYGHLSVRASPFAPFFGEDETHLMHGFALLADLALARADLFVRLRTSNEELEQFAYVASHDLQEPLRTVASYAELMARRYGGQLDEKAERYITFMVDGCQRMQDLINDLLHFSRVGTKAGPLAPTDLDAPLDSALRNLEARIAESGAVIRRTGLPTAAIDESQMALVFQNLIGNAIKFRGTEPPEIDIRGEAVDGEIVITVHDNGIGIDPRYGDRIFTIFQRLHTRSEYPGTGLGLAICKKVVERHGGRIWLDDDRTSGAAFKFSLPALRSTE